MSRIGPPLLLAVTVYCGYHILLQWVAKPVGWVRMDYLLHALTARDWWRGGSLRTPHFLFEALILGCHMLFSTSDVLSTALMVTGLSAVAAAWVTYAFWIRQVPAENERDYWVAALWSLGLQVAGPITLATIWANSFYLGYIYPASTYHNPTIVLLKPLALLSFALTLSALERSMTGQVGWSLVL